MKEYTEKENLSLSSILKESCRVMYFSRAHDICAKNLYNWLDSYGNLDIPQIERWQDLIFSQKRKNSRTS